MLTKVARSFVILSALAAAGLIATSASAETIKDSGSFDAAYVKRDTRPIPDQQGHMLLLTESSGTSANSGGLVDGFPTTVHELAAASSSRTTSTTCGARSPPA